MTTFPRYHYIWFDALLEDIDSVIGVNLLEPFA